MTLTQCCACLSHRLCQPFDFVRFAAAFGSMIAHGKHSTKVIIGKDGRISGSMVSDLVTSTLTGLGINVVDLGFSTTPTVELAIKMEGADGGIIITASHN